MERSWIARIPVSQKTDNPANIYTNYRMNNQPDRQKFLYSKFENKHQPLGFTRYGYNA